MEKGKGINLSKRKELRTYLETLGVSHWQLSTNFEIVVCKVVDWWVWHLGLANLEIGQGSGDSGSALTSTGLEPIEPEGWSTKKGKNENEEKTW